MLSLDLNWTQLSGVPRFIFFPFSEYGGSKFSDSVRLPKMAKPRADEEESREELAVPNK